MTSTQKSLSLDQKLWAKIDGERGEISRSRFVSKILVDFLEKSHNSQSTVQTDSNAKVVFQDELD